MNKYLSEVPRKFEYFKSDIDDVPQWLCGAAATREDLKRVWEPRLEHFAAEADLKTFREDYASLELRLNVWGQEITFTRVTTYLSTLVVGYIYANLQSSINFIKASNDNLGALPDLPAPEH
jgi:hypothetical protein